MSDKNFKVKNGIDAVGPITISPSSSSITSLIINSVSGGTGIIFNRNGSQVGSIDDWGTYNGSGINIVQPWHTRSPGIEAQSFFWVGSGARSSAGFAGTNSGTNPVIYISQNGTATNDLTQWIRPDNTILAKVDYLGNITANDLTLAGNLTVNGTTTNLNSTNLIIEDKNIIIADVATPTDTTADGAGITIKGATDKTLNWVQSTGSFTSSEPFIINTNSTTRPALIVKAIASQTSAVQEWQDSNGSSVANIDKSGYFRGPLVEARPINPGLYGVAIAANASQSGDLFQITDTSNNAYTGVSSTGKFVTGNTTNASRFTQITDAALGQLTVYAPTASTIGMVIRGAASQTADLFQVQDSGGTVRVAFERGGALSVAPSTALNGYTGFFKSPSAGVAGIMVRGAASQTANLQEWQNSAEVSVAQISATGTISTKPVGFSGNLNTAIISVTDRNSNWTPGNFAFRSDSNGIPRFSFTGPNASSEALTINGNWVGIQTPNPTANFQVTSKDATHIGSIVKGAASQTANLQEWQNSSGTVLTSVDKDGYLQTPRLVITNGGNIIDSAGTTPYFGFGSNQIAIYARNAAYKPLIIQGAASQTANLQEWQDSSGTVLNTIAASGTLVIGGSTVINSTFGITLFNKTLAAYYSANNTSYQPGFNFTRGNTTGAWMNIGTTGDAANGVASIDIRDGGNTKLFSVGYAGNTSISLNSASSVGLIVKGAASQTGDLTQWRNSADTVLARVYNNGVLSAGSLYAATGDLAVAYGGYFGGGTAGSYIGAAVSVIPWTTAVVGVIVRGRASQTANLQEWQNSSGTVLASISSTGKLTSAVDASINGLTIGLGGGSGPTNIALGGSALLSNTTGFGNSAIGLGALQSNTTGWGNVGIGTYALQNYSGNVNTAIGYLALRNTTAEGLVAIGYGSLASNTSGGANTAVGYGALNANITGGANTAFGSQSSRLSTGDRNTSVGFYSAYGLTTGTDNTFLGSQTGQSFTTGSSNIAIGSYNSWYGTSTGSGNTFVGTDGGGTVTGSNNTTLGYQATISSSSVSNEVTVGNSSITKFRIPGIGLTITSNSTINANSASTVGLTVKGAASQTANLQEWQNSAGNISASIDKDGISQAQLIQAKNTLGVVAGGTESQVKVVSPDGSKDIRVWNRNDAGGFYYFNSGGSSANVLRITHSTPTRMALQLVTDFTNLSSAAFGGRVNIDTVSTGAVGLAIRGVASQTANLQEWQDSAGNVLAKIHYDGKLTVGYGAGGGIAIGSMSFGGVTYNGISNPSGVTTLPTIVIKGIASQTANLQEWQNSAGGALVGISSSGALGVSDRITGYQGISAWNASSFGAPSLFQPFLYDSIVNISTVYAGALGLVIRGVASQTGDLQQWRNSAGTVLSSINSGGNLILGNQYISNSGASGYGRLQLLDGGTNQTIFYPASAGLLIANAGVVGMAVVKVRGASGQTANLQEWQNSAGGVLLNIDSTGSLDIGAGSSNLWRIKNQTSTVMEWQPSQGFMFLPYGSSNRPVTIKGAASQTGDLTQWQNSAGTTYARIDAYGTFQNGTASGYGAWINVQPLNATDRGIIVRGHSSQTANLQEWQNSTGTVLANVDSNGKIAAPIFQSTVVGTAYIATGSNNNAIRIQTNGNANVGLQVRGEASQTANLQEWQNSSGTVLSAIDTAGNFTKGDGDQLVLAGQIFG